MSPSHSQQSWVAVFSVRCSCFLIDSPFCELVPSLISFLNNLPKQESQSRYSCRSCSTCFNVSSFIKDVECHELFKRFPQQVMIELEVAL